MAGSATGRLQLGGWEAKGKRGNPSTQEGGPTGRCRVRPLGRQLRTGNGGGAGDGAESFQEGRARKMKAGSLTSSTVEAMLGLREGRPQLQRRTGENSKRRTDRAYPERRQHRHLLQWPRPEGTPDAARDLGPPPARGASRTFASPSRPPPGPKHRLRGSAPPLLAWPRPAPPTSPLSKAQLSRLNRKFEKRNASTSTPGQLYVIYFDPVGSGCAVATQNRCFPVP